MTAPVWLIAEREFRTYVATISFWLALAIGPLAGGVVLLFSGPHAAVPTVAIRVGDAELRRAAAAALEEAGRPEGQHYIFAPDGDARVTFSRRASVLNMEFSGRFPLSPTGRALVGRILERDAARRAAHAVSLTVHETQADAGRGLDAAAAARFVTLLMLWLTLTGSLGMLLQTVVRERANRALESLLAAACPWEIVAGKIAGVGAISLLVLVAWLGSAAVLSSFVAGQVDLASSIIAELVVPVNLVRDAVIYFAAYAFYGSVTVALGAMARDAASAQNLARPMFAILLVGFFVALSNITGNGAGAWVVYLPFLTPFLLLTYPSGAVPLFWQALLLVLLLGTSTVAGNFAARRLSFSSAGALFSWRKREISIAGRGPQDRRFFSIFGR